MCPTPLLLTRYFLARTQPPRDKAAGKKLAPRSVPASVSRDILSFDLMLAALTSHPLTHVDVPHSGIDPAGPGAGGRESVDGHGLAGATPYDQRTAATATDDDAEDRRITTAAVHAMAPHVGGSAVSYAPLPLPPPAPPPPRSAHPIFGAPNGKSGGRGGGKLVETLRPLVSGNARCWLVVSVGGGGKGGAGAAWRSLDVARQGTGIATTCIRLRWVCLPVLFFLEGRGGVIGRRRPGVYRASSAGKDGRVFFVFCGCFRRPWGRGVRLLRHDFGELYYTVATVC